MHQKRIKILLGIFAALILTLVVRLGYVQIIDGSKYSGISEKKGIKRTPLEALRGKIYDRDGILMATNKHAFNISVQYKDILYYYLKSKNELLPRLKNIKKHQNISAGYCGECHSDKDLKFKRLLNILEMDQNELLERVETIVNRVEKIKKLVSKKNKKEIVIREEISVHPVAVNVPFDKVAGIEINHNDIPGVIIDVKPYRLYPNGSLAAHIIGYTKEIKKSEWEKYGFKDIPFGCDTNGVDSGEAKLRDIPEVTICDEVNFKRLGIDNMFLLGYPDKILAGRSGIEASYNMFLLGKPGERFEEVTVDSSIVDKIILERPSVSGENIYLTISGRLQFIAERSLGNRTASVIVMNPWNGEIIAMATAPGFDPNTFNADFAEIIGDKRNPLLNRPIQSTLPPGSAFKIVTAVAALAEGKISNETMFECKGWIGAQQERFRCFSKYGHGMLNVEDALKHSCNSFFFNIAKQIGADLLYKWGGNFGFGQKSGIDIPYERNGLLPKPRSIAELMNISIGQGAFLASPLQITKMTSMIANGGRNIKPHILLKVANSDGSIVKHPVDNTVDSPIIAKDVIDIVKRGLIKVVQGGTARNMGIEKYLVAGKTGTAETGKNDVNHAWFTGFAPYDNPEYCFTVLVEHTPEHGADATAPVLQSLLAGLFPESEARIQNTESRIQNSE